MWKSLQQHAAKHSMFYAIGIFLGLQGFFTGYYDNFWPIEREDMAKLGWWQVIAALFKSLSFALGIVAGYMIKQPAPGSGPADETNPPVKTVP